MPDTAPPDIDALCAALAAPFERQFVKFRPGATSGNRALAIPYVDARVIMDRLDGVVGTAGWSDEYEFLHDEGSVLCRLRLRLGGEWITKMDVGGPSEQPDEGDRRKAAVSDALKRAAVKFGVGRYLYRLPQTWVDYDPQKKQLKSLPPLPEGKPAAGAGRTATGPQGAARGRSLPADGPELAARLARHEAALVKVGRCAAGDLLAAVAAAGQQAGFGAEVERWAGPAILLAVDEVKAFDAAHRVRPAAPAKLLSPDDQAQHEVRPTEPSSALDLGAWLAARDAELAAEELCAPGAFADHVFAEAVAAGVARGPLSAWEAPAVAWAVALGRRTAEGLRTRRAASAAQQARADAAARAASLSPAEAARAAGIGGNHRLTVAGYIAVLARLRRQAEAG